MDNNKKLSIINYPLSIKNYFKTVFNSSKDTYN
jgi:hypothetical protein